MPDKPLVWLRGEVKSPPLSSAARLEVGVLLRRLQRGERLTMPHSRPLRSVGRRVHELRFTDRGRAWRIVYRIDPDAVVIGDVFEKKGQRTPKRVVEGCRSRFTRYDEIVRNG